MSQVAAIVYLLTHAMIPIYLWGGGAHIPEELVAKQIDQLLIEVNYLEDFSVEKRQYIKSLLLETYKHESTNGKCIRQIVFNNGIMTYGPARGIFQIEPATHNDILVRYLNKNTVYAKFYKKIIANRYLGDHDATWNLTYNINYQVVMCYLVYYMKTNKFKIKLHNLNRRARAYKKYYNTFLGDGSIVKFINTNKMTPN